MPGSKRVGFGPVQVLGLLAIAELGVYRVVVPALQVVVPQGQPVPPTPLWQEALGWLGLFLHYFVGTLAIAMLVARAIRGVRARTVRGLVLAVPIGALALLAAYALALGEDATTAFLLETALVAVVLAAFAASLGAEPEAEAEEPLGVSGTGPLAVWYRRYQALVAGFLRHRSLIGLGLVAAPFVVHYYGVIGGKFLWPEEAAEMTGGTSGVTRTGVSALCLAAILSAYCWGPRPFARSLFRLLPIAVAMGVAAGAAYAGRNAYLGIADVVKHAIGIELTRDQQDPQLALYILAFSTLCWTLAAGATAYTPERRRAAAGLALVVLGGYHPVVWPAYYALIAVGLATLVDAMPTLRPAERVDRVAIATPEIDDRIWQGWVTDLVGGLRGAGHQVNALTSRGEGEHASTIVTGLVAARPFRMQIERIAGAVVVIDTRFGRELGDRPATFTIAAREDGLADAHPEPPPAGPRLEVGERGFDGRFRARGDRGALVATLDDDARLRLTATLDGWLAVWKGESVRHRLYPGRGAPIDHPIPLSELALRGAGPQAAARMVTLVGVIADVARRVVPEAAPAPDSSDALPAVSDDPPPGAGESEAP